MAAPPPTVVADFAQELAELRACVQQLQRENTDLHSQLPPGFHTMTREPKRAHLNVRSSKTPPKFNEKTPRERRKKEISGGREKKRAKFWAVQGKGGPAEGGPGERPKNLEHNHQQAPPTTTNKHHQQTPTGTNRHQQAPTGTNRQQQATTGPHFSGLDGCEYFYAVFSFCCSFFFFFKKAKH